MGIKAWPIEIKAWPIAIKEQPIEKEVVMNGTR